MSGRASSIRTATESDPKWLASSGRSRRHSNTQRSRRPSTNLENGSVGDENDSNVANSIQIEMLQTKATELNETQAKSVLEKREMRSTIRFLQRRVAEQEDELDEIRGHIKISIR